MKRKIWIILGLAFLLLFSVTLGIAKKREISPRKENEKSYSDKLVEELVIDENRLLGQWKVTEYAAAKYGIIPSYSFYEHFLGRSVALYEGKIVRSIVYWPNEVDYDITNYQRMEKRVEDAYAYGRDNQLDSSWHDRFDGQKIEIYSFYETQDSIDNFITCIVAEDGTVMCRYIHSYLCMEPYMPAKTNINTEQLYGTWKVERLVSYQDGWKGNNAVLPEARRFEPDTVYLESEGAEFYPLDYYAAAFVLNMDSAVLHMENGTEEQYTINRYESELVDTKTYQKEEGIHDELGLTNEEIQVLDVDVANDSEAMLWDGKIVVVSEEKMIIKLHQGWFLLVKSID